MDRRRFSAARKKSGGYIPPQGVYWDLAKNVGYCPVGFAEWTGEARQTSPSLFVEYENRLDKNKYGSEGIAFITAGYNTQGNGFKDLSQTIASSVNQTFGYGLIQQTQAYRIERWRGGDGVKSMYILGGEAKGTFHTMYDVDVYRTETANMSNGWSVRYDGYIKFGCKMFGDIFNPADYPTNADLLNNLDAINGIGEGGECKLRQFIYWHDNTSFTTLEELLNARDTAEVDIRFDSNGNPYNGGTSGDLIFTNVE